MSTSVVSDVINYRKIKKRNNKIKLRHEEEDEEEKESDFEDNCSHDDNKNIQCDLIKINRIKVPWVNARLWRSIFIEWTLRMMKKLFWNDESVSIGIDNEWKQVNRKRGACECNELLDEHNKIVEEKQYLRKKHCGLLVNHRKLVNEHNEVINELANDWKEKWKNNKKNKWDDILKCD